jgi:photosystem II stability/assembly factor-like uncharacterized protein
MPVPVRLRSLPALALLLALLPLAAWTPSLHPGKPRTSGAMQSLEFLARARAYPDSFIPERGHFDAVQAAARLPEFGASAAAGGSPSSRHPRHGADLAPASHEGSAPWRGLGPFNIGGRTLFVAVNPLNPNTLYAGSASGGLWRSHGAGVGPSAWRRIVTGFPVLSASCFAFAPGDTNVMYLGTGEVYGYQSSLGGMIHRSTRGSYGIGILKSTDGGATWSMSLDWSRDQKRGVWAIRVDPEEPNRVWAATTEGVYRSHDAGATWDRVLSVVMAMDLEVDPQNPDTVYAACGNFSSPGYGVYRTFNGGANWTKLGGGLPTVYAGKAQITVSPQFPNVIYAGVANGSTSAAGTYVLRSYDWGNTWTLASGATDYASYQGWYSHDIHIHPGNYEWVYMAGIDFWRSTNAGATPSKMTDWSLAYGGVVPVGGPEGPSNYVHADIHAITFHPTNNATIYLATDGGVFRTTNGGTSWQGLNGGYVTSQFYPGFAVSPSDTVPALGGMQDNFSAIFEGTAAWNRVIGGDGCWAAIDPTNPLVMFGSYQGLNILKSIDGGVNWSNATPPVQGGPTSFVAPFVMSPVNPQVMFAGRSIVYRSVNQGATWLGGNAVVGRPIVSMAASPHAEGRVIFGTEPATGVASVFRSDDYGVNAVNIAAGLPDRYPLDVAIAPDAPNTFYVTFGGFGVSHVWKSVDAGATWQDIGSSLPDLPTWAIAVDPLYPDHLYVGNDLGVFVSPDGGATWGAFREGLPEAVIVSDLVLIPGLRRIRVVTHGNGTFERPLPDVVTGVADGGPAAPRAPLLAAAPNPFVRTTRLHLSEPIPAAGRALVFDASGRRVRALELPAGAGAIDWDGRDDAGRPVAAGSYFVRLDAGPRRAQALRIVRLPG